MNHSHCPYRLVAVTLLATTLVAAVALRADDAGMGPDAAGYSEIVIADHPVAYWRFETIDGGGFRNLAGPGAVALPATCVGTVQTDIAGPGEDEFPQFPAGNRAIGLAADGYLRVQDSGASSPLDFGPQDAVTMEAWVRPTAGRNQGYVYLLGKGRTENPSVAKDNQNYALRLSVSGSSAAVTFLFRSAGIAGDWHRWTSDAAMALDGGWHHVAVSYRFGDSESVRGYIDGQPVAGRWDMGGATERPPVVDDDELWIGSSLGGKPSSSFHGQLDEVAIYRGMLPPERLRERYGVRVELATRVPDVVPDDGVLVEVFEGIPDAASWRFREPRRTDSFTTPAFAFTEIPQKYSPRGLREDRSNPYLIRAWSTIELPPGTCKLAVRARNASRLFVDGVQVAETPFFDLPASGHGTVEPLDRSLGEGIRALARGDSQALATIESALGQRRIRFEMIVGGRKHRPEFGETSVSIASRQGEFQLLAPHAEIPLTDAGWQRFTAEQRRALARENTQRRRTVDRQEREYWEGRHALAREQLASRGRPDVPQPSSRLAASTPIDHFINQTLDERRLEVSRLTSDLEFLRRIALDLLGTVPAPEQIEQFRTDRRPDRRSRWIDTFLRSDAWADNWVGYWQDVLAENPNIVNPTLNNTGPFRWWIYESLLDNKPFDRFVTELVMMEGSTYFGGPAGFGLATENDAPMAAKAHVVGQAFLALEMKCARCHDAPYHDFRQRDLFQLAAMLKRDAQEVPASSSIPGGEDAAKSLLVEVTLKPGERVAPEWSFPELIADAIPTGVIRDPEDSRERLAALVTSAGNRRFARVIANRLWKRYLGHGLVEPVDDWEYADPSHPELLDYLAAELIESGYDLKHVTRLILNSQVYQRVPKDAGVRRPGPDDAFAAPIRRRMTAEQLVDSLFQIADKPLDAGPICIDVDGAPPETLSLNLGVPTRAWQFASLSNERDRPSLAMPYAQPFVTLMESFGWRSSRQDPITERMSEPTVQQPALLASGIVSQRITRVSDDSAFARLAIREPTVDDLVRAVFLRVLTRDPTPAEFAMFGDLLADGYQSRIIAREEPPTREPVPRGVVSWSNHLHPEASVVKARQEAAIREGDPPATNLEPEWRQRFEDLVWVLMNSPEFLYLP